MASSKCHLSFFLAITLIAAMSQPSAAVRADPPASSTTGAKPSKWHLSDILPSCWPFPPIFGPPATPTPPTPCKPRPKECLPAMTGMLPCKDFLTNKSAPAPPYPGKCCDGMQSFMKDYPVCLGHLVDGEFDKFMSAPIEDLNFVDLLDICHSDDFDDNFCNGPTPPVKAGPPPPSKPELKECLSPMMGVMPCKDFITNKTAPAPPYPSKCCDGFKSLMEDSTVCICHLFDGEFDKFMSAPVDDANFVGLMDICHADPNQFNCDGPVPPVWPPPTP